MPELMTMGTRRNRRIALWRMTLLAVALFTFTASARAHPLSQGALDIVVGGDRITVHARVSTEEVSIANSSTGSNPIPGPWAAAGSAAFDQHAQYLAAHLHFTADGAPLTGRVVKVTPPDEASPADNATAVYDLEYPLPAGPVRIITLMQDALADAHLAGGQSWTTLYHVTLSQNGRPAIEALLSRGEPVNFVEDAEPTTKWSLFKSYCMHGIDHILGEPTGRGIFSRTDLGFDHLLFVTALVLGTKSLWDLLKVVTAFTLAHTITLSLAATKILHVPESVSEPLIALSIVFVAVQNVFWPRQSRGALRYAAAFFFGLFHGLGFAGGLLDTMQQMRGTSIFLAILAFSIGVELGHQFVVIPLFTLLKLWRDTRASEPAGERLHFNVQRFGSAVISLAGLFYLVLALKISFRAS